MPTGEIEKTRFAGAIYPFGGARRQRSFHVGVGSLSQRRTAAGSIATEWFFLRVHCESGGRESPSGVSVGTCARTRLARLNRVRRSVVKSKRVRDLLSDDALPQKRHQPAVCCMRLGRPRGSELGRGPRWPWPGGAPWGCHRWIGEVAGVALHRDLRGLGFGR